jgi:hypothetical protein
VRSGALQSDRRDPAGAHVVVAHRLTSLVDAAIADASNDRAAHMATGAAGDRWGGADPAAPSLLLDRAAVGAVPAEVSSLAHGFSFTVNSAEAVSGSPTGSSTVTRIVPRPTLFHESEKVYSTLARPFASETTHGKMEIGASPGA